MIKIKSYEVEDEILQELLDNCADGSFEGLEENKIRSKPIKPISDQDWEDFNPEIKKNKRYIDEWLDTIIRPNKSAQTLKQYKSCLRQFAFWNEKENDGVSFSKIRKRAFIRYQNYLLDTGMSKKTLELKRNAVSSFCNFLEIYIAEEDGAYDGFRNFVKGTEIPEGRNKVYDKQPVTYEEFIKVCKRLKQLKTHRLYTIWICLFYTGKRITEILQLKTSDIKDIPEGHSYVESGIIRGKGRGIIGKEYTIRLNKYCIDALKEYMKHRIDNGSEYVFYGETPDVHLDGDTVRVEFSTIISSILGRRCNPHLLRGSFATYLLNNGVSLTTVQQLLKHESVETTSKSYDLRDKESLVNNELKDLNI